MTEPAVEETNPFGSDQAPGVSLIVLMRIYDVLMAQLQVSDPQKAANLLELHAAGALLGSAPRVSGRFVFDEINDE